MHTTETLAREVSAMEAGASPGADEAGKDLVATVKEEPQDDIKDYAETTMNELLGLYGYDKVSIQDTEHLNLDKYGTGDQSPSSSRDDTCTPPLSDHGNDTDDISSICSNPNETALAAQHKNLVSALNSRHGSREGEKESSGTRIICSWCQKSGSKLFTLKSSNGNKAFCSEVCFTQCRRASFKKNKVCDWCKHVRHTVNYVDFQDGEIQLQFCCEKCLNQYKMNIFCRETEEHLSQIQSQIRCPSSDSEDLTGFPPEDSSVNKQILITPDLWLQDRANQDKVKHGDPDHDGMVEGSAASAPRKIKLKTEVMDGKRPDCLESRRQSSGSRKRHSRDHYDRFDRRSVEQDESREVEFHRERHRPKDKARRLKPGEPRLSARSPNHTPGMVSPSNDPSNVASPMLPSGPLYPQWFPPPHMLGSFGGAQMSPFFPMGPQSHPLFYSHMGAKPGTAPRKGSRHSPHPPTPQDTPDSTGGGRDRCDADMHPSSGAHRNHMPMFWPRGVPPMPTPFGCPVGPGPIDRGPAMTVPVGSTQSGPPVTMMVPFPVVLPIPIPIPLPIPLTTDQIRIGLQKLKGNNGNTSASATEGNNSTTTTNSSQDLNKDVTPVHVNSQETKEPVQISGLPRCDSRASSASARSFTSLSKSPLCREAFSRSGRSTSSPATMEGVREGEEPRVGRLVSPIASPVISSDEAIDLSTDKSGHKGSARSSTASYKTCSESRNGEASASARGENSKPSLPKIHIVNVKQEPPLSQELPLPKTNHPYNKRRGLILDAPFVPKKPRSPSPERRVYVRNPPRDIYELQARRRCVRAKLRSK